MIYWLRQRKTLLISQLSDSLQYGLYWQKREGLLAELLKVGGGGARRSFAHFDCALDIFILLVFGFTWMKFFFFFNYLLHVSYAAQNKD